MRTSQSTPVSASGLTETTATVTTITPRMQFSKQGDVHKLEESIKINQEEENLRIQLWFQG